uniref:Uncharacterized protein n=1 Tax=Nymphaea colorata TaxID=210225 RepID=A0A5K1ESL7_9MAGN|nr:unnamed protein product [Nymphaea colorata]
MWGTTDSNMVGICWINHDRLRYHTDYLAKDVYDQVANTVAKAQTIKDSIILTKIICVIM